MTETVRRLNVISMPRTGHRAIMVWCKQRLTTEVYNTEGRTISDSLQQQGMPLLVLRDFRNWMASLVKHMLPLPERADTVEEYIDMWMGHMEAAFTVPTILYPEWVRAGHGRGVTIKGNATEFVGGDTLHRYEQMNGNQLLKEAVERRKDALALDSHVFGRNGGLPPIDG